ncbi:MAG: DsbA family oxidoreductase [Microthrixaceae bacterium]
MRIDIWSDVVCPWCYLGAHRLRAALDRVGHDGIEVHWRAFQLDPSAPARPRELRSVLEAKYGQGSFEAMTERLVDLGRADGIEYRFDRALSINTADAHRIAAFAGDPDGADGGGAALQDRVVERLFRGYFTDGEDLSDHAVLVAAANNVGLDPDAAADVLAGDRYATQVRQDQELAQERGITGVPAFVIDDQWLIPGAQDVDRLVALIERVRSREVAGESGGAAPLPR